MSILAFEAIAFLIVVSLVPFFLPSLLARHSMETDLFPVPVPVLIYCAKLASNEGRNYPYKLLTTKSTRKKFPYGFSLRQDFEKLGEKELGEKLIKKAKDLGLHLEIIGTEVSANGNVFTFRFRPKKRTRAERFIEQAVDIQYYFKRTFQLFEAFKKNGGLYLTVSETGMGKVDLWEFIEDPLFKDFLDFKEIPVILGLDLQGKLIVEDLTELIHLLVGGSSGSGKSVLLRSIICSIIAVQPIQRVNLILFDMGKGDLTIFDGVPHLSCPVVQDVDTALKVILSLEAEMERRLEHPEEFDKWPYLVFISDESSMRVTKFTHSEDRGRYTDANSNILRDGRKTKIIVIQVAQETRRDSMKIEMGNFASKIAFACSDYHQSISISGEGGAEKLPGNGAMFFKSRGHSSRIRLQGAYPEPEDIERLVSYLSTKSFDTDGKFYITESDLSESNWDEEMVLEVRQPAKSNLGERELCRILAWTLEQEQISANKVKDHFHISDIRATAFVDRLTELGIVSEKISKQPRFVLCGVHDLPEQAMALLINNGFQLTTTDDAFTDNSESMEADDDGKN